MRDFRVSSWLRCVALPLAAGILLSVAGSTAVSAASHMKIGILEEPKTLNVWLASDTWSNKVLGFIYQDLYIRDPATLKLIPWLAAQDPVYDPQELSYTVKLRPAKWSDGTEVTSEDVAFTGQFIKEFKIPRFLSKWDLIKRMETPDKQTIKFYLESPQATFLDRTLTTPIVQKKEWTKLAEEARKAEKPLTEILNTKIERPTGCGPFILKEWKKGAYVFLEKNKDFFGKGLKIGAHVLGPHIDGMIFKHFGTSDAAILDLKKGGIDMFWWGIQPGYLSDLKTEKEIQLFTSERSALYYIGFNLRKTPFNDKAFRRAVATLVDQDFIIQRILQGYGTRMYSIIPPGNTQWYCPGVPRYGEGFSKDERIKKAHALLKEAGYTWEVSPVTEGGKVVKGEGIKLPGGIPMEKFTILTPPADYDPHRAMAGMMLQEWLKDLGIPATARPMAFGALMEHVKDRREFDSFILGYGNLSLDPDYLRNFFLSANDKRGGWNMSGYKNPEFDALAEASVGAMDPEERKRLVWQMQILVMEDLPYLPLYNPTLIEAVRKDRFRGWVEMLGGIGNMWSFCVIKGK